RGDLNKRKELQDLLNNKTITDKEKIERVLSIYNELGIKEAAEEAMIFYHNKATEALSNSGLNKEQRARLAEFADSVINREK
ncbi:MAG TPA: isoprenyl synthetase, partial [Rikenellaceae bacterium]|nr:isoprenyl synthetase [Rikenellaceae bacterium]